MALSLRAGLSKESERIWKEKNEQASSSSIHERLYTWQSKTQMRNAGSVSVEKREPIDLVKQQRSVERLVQYQRVQDENLHHLQEIYHKKLK